MGGISTCELRFLECLRYAAGATLGDPAELLLLTDDAEYGPDDAESEGGGGIFTDIGCPLPPLRPVLGLIFFHQTAIYMSSGRASDLPPGRAQLSPTTLHKKQFIK